MQAAACTSMTATYGSSLCGQYRHCRWPTGIQGMKRMCDSGALHDLVLGAAVTRYKDIDARPPCAITAYPLKKHCRYAERVRAHLYNFFLNPDTRMNPNLNHAQVCCRTVCFNTYTPRPDSPPTIPHLEHYSQLMANCWHG